MLEKKVKKSFEKNLGKNGDKKIKKQTLEKKG